MENLGKGLINGLKNTVFSAGKNHKKDKMLLFVNFTTFTKATFPLK